MLENIVLSAAKRFTNVSNSDFWFGANDLSAQGKWAWIDGTPFRFKDWDNGQPQNSLDNGCGAVIMQGAKWISDNCFKQKPFVCTVPALAEAKTTTSPPQTECSDGWTYFNYTNSCYKVIVKNLTWSDAEMECVKEGSHLISIHSWREIVYATNLAAPYSTNEYAWTAQTWIGMSTQDNNAHFKWTDGTPFDYTDFAPGEPNSPGYENCSNIWTGQISDEGIYPCRLYNYFCNVSNANFICKKSL
uniref:C-type lectin domain-containing protein n=1 Tax=Panagrolaimus davidi TaxID=227884 RepID=A0A914PG95_9BILA